jgi:hypothetical protein
MEWSAGERNDVPTHPKLDGEHRLHLAAGTYNIDSLTETGNTALVLDSVPVILNVTGSGGGIVVQLTGVARPKG